MSTVDDLTVQHEPEHSRYVATLEGRPIGVADYFERDQVVVMHHTEVAPAYGGQGYGKVLVTSVLDDLRARERTVVPRCWFVAQVIDEEPQYEDLLAVQSDA